MRTFLIAAALMLTPIIATAQSAPTSSTPEKGTMIYVDATGRASAVPDVAVFSVSVFSKAPTSAQALRDTAVKAENLISTLRKQGIAERDLRTTSTQVTQSFVYKENGVRGESDGFVATTTISAKLRNLAKSSSLLDNVASQGATTIMGPTYELSNDVPLRRQARDMAIREAQKNAEEVARTLDKRVLRLVSLRLAAITPPTERPHLGTTSVGSVQVRGSRSQQILPGELQVSSTVNAVFELTD